jgi:hypothetical protein
MHEMRSQRAYFVITCDHVSKTNVGNRPGGCHNNLSGGLKCSLRDDPE